MMLESTALTKRPEPSDQALMPPPPPKKRIKRPQKVLDEDTYTDALSHIIARDFFPGLLESETQQEYLDALDAGDEEWILEAERQARQAMTPGRKARRGVTMTPMRSNNIGETPVEWRGGTPGSVKTGRATPSRVGEGMGRKTHSEEAVVDVNMGLTAFQSKYTSEDNESFYKLLDKQNLKRAEKYSWMWNGNKIPSARQITQAAHNQKLLDAASNKEESPTTAQALVLSRPSDQDARPAMIDPRSNNQGPRNSLMFTPDDLSDSGSRHISIAQAAQDASNAPPKAVSYVNTRIPQVGSTSDQSIPPSPSISAIDAAISGRRPAPSTTASSTISPVSGNETPRVNGYAYVDAEPTPSELAVVSSSTSSSAPVTATLLSQLISNNTPSSTTDAGSTTPNPFTIAPSQPREALHHRIVAKQLKAKRNSTSASALPSRLTELQGSRTPTPKFMSSPRVTRGNPSVLTPAAQRLYEKVGRTPKQASNGKSSNASAFDFDAGKKRGGFTPTPIRAKRQE